MPPRPVLHLSRLLGVSLLTLASAQAARAQDSVTLDTVVVDGNGREAGTGEGGGLETEGYVASEVRAGTKTDTAIERVPQSIAVVSREQIEDRKVQTLTEAVNYTAGVTTSVFGFDPRFDSFYIRGFNVQETGVYRDGLRELGAGFAFPRTEPYTLGGITILKGPSSVLYGGGSPGGIVNLTSKRPTEDPFYEVEAQIGTQSRRQLNFDASGPMGEGDNFLYRLTGVARDADTDYIGVADDRGVIAPAFTFRSDDRNTHLTILGEYGDLTTGGGVGYFTENGRPTPYQLTDPAYADFDQEQWRIGYEFEHRFNETVTVRQNLRTAHVDADVKYTQIDAISPDRLTATRSAWRIPSTASTFQVDNQAQFDFDTGEVKHQVLGGIDYSYIDASTAYGFTAAPDLDLVRLNYGQQRIDGPSAIDAYRLDTLQNQTGVYLQDQAEYRRFVLTLGGRYDWLTTKTFNILPSTASNEQDDTNFSGRVGLAYLFDNGLSPYVSYSTSFAPTVGSTFSGSAFSPSKGEQEEVGIKYKPADLNLLATAALFRIRQSNVLSTDPVNNGFQIQQGEVTSQGFELELTASVVEGLNVTGAYTYLDLENTGGDNLGFVPLGIPRQQFSLWTDYTVQGGIAEGLSFGAGTRFLGPTWADARNTRENDSRVMIDAMVAYDFGAANEKLEGVKAQINAKNLFDEDDTTCNGGFCYRDQGRQVIGSLRYRF
jgi:iron complex outermembrane recepter protein